MKHISKWAWNYCMPLYNGPHIDFQPEQRDPGLLGRLCYLKSAVRVSVFLPDRIGIETRVQEFDEDPMDVSDDHVREVFESTLKDLLKEANSPLQFSSIGIETNCYRGEYVLEARAVKFS